MPVNKGRTSRSAVAFLALTVILLRAIVPVGWMPATSADGTTIVLCTAQGLVEVTLDADGNPLEEDGQQEITPHAAPCVFAASAHYSAPPQIFGPAPSPGYSIIAVTDEVLLEPSSSAHKPAQARAPPTIS